MTHWQIAAVALAALLVFWMLGAHNRLVALRNGIGAAWAKVDEALQLRSAAAAPLLAALRQPLAAEQGALDKLQATLADAAAAAAALASRPVVQAHAAAWVAAEAALAAAAARVLALLEQHADVSRQEHIAGGIAAWADASARLGFARQLFNDAAAFYNDAIALFPTRLLVGMFRFGPAGRI